MAEKKRKMSAERWVILGLLVVMISMLGGFAVASGSPSSIHTCTTTSNGKIKVTSNVCKAGKATSDTWDNHTIVLSQLAAKDATIAARDAQILTLRTDGCALVNGLLNDGTTLIEIVNQPTLLAQLLAVNSDSC